MPRPGRGTAARRGRGGHKVEVSAQNSPQTGVILYRYFYCAKTFKYFYFLSPTLRRQHRRRSANTADQRRTDANGRRPSSCPVNAGKPRRPLPIDSAAARRRLAARTSEGEPPGLPGEMRARGNAVSPPKSPVPFGWEMRMRRSATWSLRGSDPRFPLRS